MPIGWWIPLGVAVVQVALQNVAGSCDTYYQKTGDGTACEPAEAITGFDIAASSLTDGGEHTPAGFQHPPLFPREHNRWG